MKTERMTGAEFGALLVRRAELEAEHAEYCAESEDPYCVRKAGIVWGELECLNADIDAQLELEVDDEYVAMKVAEAAEDELSPR